MEQRNKGLIIFGIILLAIGLVASFYHEVERTAYEEWSEVSGHWQTAYKAIDKGYPYQTIGIVLAVAGIVFVALGLLYPTRKTPPPLTSPQQPSST